MAEEVDGTTATDPKSNSNNNSKLKTEDDSVFHDSDSFPTMGMTKEQSKALREISRRATRVSKRKRDSRVSFATVPEIINELYEGGSSKPEAQKEIAEYEEIKEEQNQLMKYVEENIIGNDTTFKGPFGIKRANGEQEVLGQVLSPQQLRITG